MSIDRSACALVSANDHVVLPPHAFVQRLPAKFANRAPHVERVRARSGLEDFLAEANLENALNGATSSDSPAVCDAWVYDGRPFPTAGSSIVDDIDAMDSSMLLPFRYDDIPARFVDPAARLDTMDRDGIVAAVCFPTVEFPCYAGHWFMSTEDRELALLTIRAYNDWLIEEWTGAVPDRFVAAICLPLWDPRLCASEIERAAAKGARAITFPEDPFKVGGPGINDPEKPWDPVFAVAEESGLPFCVHVGSAWWVPPSAKSQSALVTLGQAATFPAWVLFDWILSGVFLRFPRIKLVLAEGKIGWIPWALETADYLWHRHRRTWGSPLPDPPSTYFADHVFGCFLPFEAQGVLRIEEIGARNCMIERDYPHPDTSFPHTRKLAVENLAHLNDHDFEMVTRLNAERVFQLMPLKIGKEAE